MNRVWSEQLYDLCSKREKSAQKCDEVNIDMDIGTSKKEGRHIGCAFSLPSWHVAPVHGAVHEQVNVLSPSVHEPPLPQGSVLQSSIFSEQSSPVNPASQIHSSSPVAVSTHSPWLLHVDASHTKSKHQQFSIHVFNYHILGQNELARITFFEMCVSWFICTTLHLFILLYGICWEFQSIWPCWLFMRTISYHGRELCVLSDLLKRSFSKLKQEDADDKVVCLNCSCFHYWQWYHIVKIEIRHTQGRIF